MRSHTFRGGTIKRDGFDLSDPQLVSIPLHPPSIASIKPHLKVHRVWPPPFRPPSTDNTRIGTDRHVLVVRFSGPRIRPLHASWTIVRRFNLSSSPRIDIHSQASTHINT